MRAIIALSAPGAALVVTGVALAYPPAAFIVAGLFCLAAPALPIWEDED